jgi:hypothetical protein
MIASTMTRAARAGYRFDVRRLTSIAAAALVATACGTKDAADPLAPTGPIGRIRFVNLITDPARNPVNAILEERVFGVNLAYTGSTPSSLPAPSTANYSPVLEGARTLVLKKTADTTVTVATLPLTITPNNEYTVFATGGTAGGTVSTFITTDVNTAPPAGQANIRVTNMSSAAGAIDVFVTAANVNLATATPVVTGLANRTVFAGASVAPGTYQIRTVPAGTAPAARAAAVITTLNDVVVAAGNGRTIVIADAPAGGAPPRSFALPDR